MSFEELLEYINEIGGPKGKREEEETQRAASQDKPYPLLDELQPSALPRLIDAAYDDPGVAGASIYKRQQQLRRLWDKYPTEFLEALKGWLKADYKVRNPEDDISDRVLYARIIRFLASIRVDISDHDAKMYDLT